MGLFNNVDQPLREAFINFRDKTEHDHQKLLLRLFGSGRTVCLNVGTEPNSDALMSEFRGKIAVLMDRVNALESDNKLLKTALAAKTKKK